MVSGRVNSATDSWKAARGRRGQRGPALADQESARNMRDELGGQEEGVARVRGATRADYLGDGHDRTAARG
jgi:hypothetical protein